MLVPADVLDLDRVAQDRARVAHAVVVVIVVVRPDVPAPARNKDST